MQIALGLDGPVVFESPQTGLHRADMLLIPPDTIHAHPAFGASAFLYLEPDSIEWIRFPGGEESRLVPLPFNPQLRPIARRAAAGDAVAVRSLVDSLIGRSPSLDHRHDALVSRTCALIRRSLDGPITLAALSEACTSRLADWYTASAKGPVCRCDVMFCGAGCARRPTQRCADRA